MSCVQIPPRRDTFGWVSPYFVENLPVGGALMSGPLRGYWTICGWPFLDWAAFVSMTCLSALSAKISVLRTLWKDTVGGWNPGLFSRGQF